MKTFTLTLEDVIAIYNAGIRRGESEACAYEWGCSAIGDTYENLVDELYRYYPDDISYSEVAKEIKNEISQQTICNNK